MCYERNCVSVFGVSCFVFDCLFLTYLLYIVLI